MSLELAGKIHAGLAELATIRAQFDSLEKYENADPGVIETAAACAMLHSFYTEIEKILKLIAREWDGSSPPPDAWHKSLLIQMSRRTHSRPAVLSQELVDALGEFLAFRHLFRGASIALMRWNKLNPLILKVPSTYERTRCEIEQFVRHIDQKTEAT